jgi:hypothetical protein
MSKLPDAVQWSEGTAGAPRDPHGPTLAGDALRMLGQQFAAERARREAAEQEVERLSRRLAAQLAIRRDGG